MLGAEYVAVAGAAARTQAIDRKFNREAGIVLNEIRNSPGGDSIELRHRLARYHACAFDSLVVRALSKYDVERDFIDSRILAADRLREFTELGGGKIDSFAKCPHQSNGF